MKKLKPKIKKKKTIMIAQPGILYVIATPIGNLEDITFRAVRVLKEVDLIAAEDTRHSRKLLSHLGISKPLISYYKENEAGRANQIVNKLAAGENVALISDAGTPAISDPGHILVKHARNKGITIVPIPGVSALTTALSVAGINKNSFLFLGFLPSRPTERRNYLKRVVHCQHHLVFYESPRRLQGCLKDCLKILGDRHIFWARELTKIHEELFSDSLASLNNELSSRQVKGESVIIISGAEKKEEPPAGNLDELLLWYKNQTDFSLKDTVKKISDDLDLQRSAVYKKALLVWETTSQ